MAAEANNEEVNKITTTNPKYTSDKVEVFTNIEYTNTISVDKPELLLPNFTIVQHGRDEFVSKEKPAKVDIDLAKKGFSHAKDVVNNGKYDLLILDELNVVVDYNLIPLIDVIKLIEGKPEKLELILTGRDAHPDLVKVADVVTEMLEIKHPYKQGILARKGIDF